MTAAVSAHERHVICMKWGTKYGPEYVNRLYAMVRRHLSGDFRFVCLTDDSTGIRSEVQCLPIPPLDLPAGIPERGWTKLATFSADLHGLRGTALFLDVDVVITGSLDEFFTQPGEFLIIHDYKRPWRITGNISLDDRCLVGTEQAARCLLVILRAAGFQWVARRVGRKTAVGRARTDGENPAGARRQAFDPFGQRPAAARQQMEAAGAVRPAQHGALDAKGIEGKAPFGADF